MDLRNKTWLLGREEEGEDKEYNGNTENNESDGNIGNDGVSLENEGRLTTKDSVAETRKEEEMNVETKKLLKEGQREALQYASGISEWMKSKVNRVNGGLRKILSQVPGGPMNESQLAAVKAAISRRITLWQGPPGTGKTRTIVRFIQIVKALGSISVLASSDSNVATDNLTEGLISIGLNVVRVGHPGKVKPSVREFTLDGLVLNHPIYMKAKEELERVRYDEEKETRCEVLLAMAKRQAAYEILTGADVVTSTCTGVGGETLSGFRFNVCVVDEATQATEPAVFIPLVHCQSDCFVLVGDPAQLPPTVVSTVGKGNGLSVSLFERLQYRGLKAWLLNTQYRMHPSIAAFPSAQFYNNRLISFPKAKDRPAPKGFCWPNPNIPLVFVNCTGKEERNGGSPSI